MANQQDGDLEDTADINWLKVKRASICSYSSMMGIVVMAGTVVAHHHCDSQQNDCSCLSVEH